MDLPGLSFKISQSLLKLMSIGPSPVAQLVKNPLQCRRPGFDPWVLKTPWRRERPPTPVFWPGEFYGLYSPWGCKKLDTIEQLSLSCTLSRWCHPTISPSFAPFSSCPQSFPASGSFPMSWLFASGGQILALWLQHHAFQWIFRVDFL